MFHQRFGLIFIHFVSLASWFGLLLRRYSKLLLGGFSLQDEPQKVSLLLQTFWMNYRKSNPSHTVFRVHQGKGPTKILYITVQCFLVINMLET